MKREQRRTPRYTFIASAELIEQKTDVRIATRVSELSLHGCYLDMMNPFPQDTQVLVKIFAGEEFFHAKAKIITSSPISVAAFPSSKSNLSLSGSSDVGLNSRQRMASSAPVSSFLPSGIVLSPWLVPRIPHSPAPQTISTVAVKNFFMLSHRL